MTNFKPNDNLEYIRALTGPTLVKDKEEQPRLPTLILGDGLKLTTNLALRTHRLDVEGGGGGDASLWAEYPAVDTVDMDGHDIQGLPTHPGVDELDAGNVVSVGTLINAITGWTPPAPQLEWIQNRWQFDSANSPDVLSPWNSFTIGGPILRTEYAGGNINEVYVDFTSFIPLTAQRAGMLRANFNVFSGLPYGLNPYGVYGTATVEVDTPTVQATTSGYFRHSSGTITIGFDALAPGEHYVTVSGRAHYVGIPG